MYQLPQRQDFCVNACIKNLARKVNEFYGGLMLYLNLNLFHEVPNFYFVFISFLGMR